MSVRGVGVRCTVDMADARANYLPRVRKALLLGVLRHLDFMEVIDLAELKSLDMYEKHLRDLGAELAYARKWGTEIAAEERRFVVLSSKFADTMRMRGMS
jgi:hypothetical protein